MKIGRSSVTAAFVASAVALGAGAPLAAQMVEVSGTWAMEVTTDQGVTTPSVRLEQDGQTLTGDYSSATLGEANVEGTVEGSEVTFRFTSVIQGQAVPVVYRGSVDENGVMSGTIDIAGGLLTGTFTATRSND